MNASVPSVAYAEFCKKPIMPSVFMVCRDTHYALVCLTLYYRIDDSRNHISSWPPLKCLAKQTKSGPNLFVICFYGVPIKIFYNGRKHSCILIYYIRRHLKGMKILCCETS